MSENDRFKPDYQGPEGDKNQNNEDNSSAEKRNTPLNVPINQNYINDSQNQQQQQNQNNSSNPYNQQINNIGNPYQQNFYQQKLVNSDAVLVLGIISIVASFCYGGGLIFGIIALVLANTANKAYMQNPSLYAPTSYSNLRAGRICAIIGVVISGLTILTVLMVGLMAFGIFSSAINSSF